MKILVTGAKGFVGKNLCAQLNNIKSGKCLIAGLTGNLEEIYEYDIDSTVEDLDKYCADCDFVFNLAGVNRPQTPEEFMQGNFGFASLLLDTLKKHGNTCPVMISSSIQATLAGRFGDSEYGRSKRAGEELMFGYGKETGAKVLVYRFPNLFGKWCRPNYNSAVATFCYNIANDLPIQVNDRSVEMELLYIDDLVDEMVSALKGEEHRCTYDGMEVVPVEIPDQVGDDVIAGPDHPVIAGPDLPVIAGPDHPVIAGPDHPVIAGPDHPVIAGPDHPVIAGPDHPVIAASDHPVIAGPDHPVIAGPDHPVIPGSTGDLTGRYCYCPITHKITLGEIVDLIRSFADQPRTLMIPEIPENSFAKKLYSTYLSYLPKEKVSFPLKMNVDERGSFTELVHTLNSGQVSINISKPGITKGQHWHNTKWEFFIVVSGHGLIQQRRVGSDEILNFEVSGDKIEAVHMLPGYTHNIINLSDTEDLVTVMYCNEIFNPDKPDTYFEPVE